MVEYGALLAGRRIPLSNTEQLPRLEGGSLYLHADYGIPKRCLRCGAKKRLQRRTDVPHHLPFGKKFAAFALLGWVGYLASRLSARTSLFRYHLCAECQQTTSDAFGAEGATGMLVAVGVVGGLAFIQNGHAVIGIALALVACGLALWVHRRYCSGRRLKATLVSPTVIRVTGTVLTSIDDWPVPRGPAKLDQTKVRCPYCGERPGRFKNAGSALVCTSCGRSFEP